MISISTSSLVWGEFLRRSGDWLSRAIGCYIVNRIWVETMRQRSFPITVLIVAFVLSAWGNVIAAAFCPRYASNRDCCVKPVASPPKQVEKSSCHHEMAGTAMDDMQMESETSPDSRNDPSAQPLRSAVASESSSNHVAFDLPIEQCPHCWSHSPSILVAAYLSAVDPSKQLIETNLPAADSRFALDSGSSISISPSEHSPPGISLPRHVLLNVFRI